MRRLSVALAFTMVARVAAAEPKPAAASSLPSQEADQRFERGMALMQQGRAEEARLMFQESYAVAPTANVLWNLAVAELDSNHLVDGLAHLRLYLASPEAKSERRAEAERLIREAYASTGHIRVSGAAGATLLVDRERRVAKAAATEVIDVVPGHHEVTAQTGGTPEATGVNAPAGSLVDVTFANPTPSLPPSAPAPVAIAPGAAAMPNREQAARPSSTRKVVTFSLAGTGGAALVLGATFAALAHHDRNRALSNLPNGMPSGTACPLGTATSPSCAQAYDAARGAATHRSLETGFFVGAALLAGGAVASWFLIGDSARIAAEPVAGGAMITVRGQL